MLIRNKANLSIWTGLSFSLDISTHLRTTQLLAHSLIKCQFHFGRLGARQWNIYGASARIRWYPVFQELRFWYVVNTTEAIRMTLNVLIIVLSIYCNADFWLDKGWTRGWVSARSMSSKIPLWWTLSASCKNRNAAQIMSAYVQQKVIARTMIFWWGECSYNIYILEDQLIRKSLNIDCTLRILP